jgi:hypothetical protein
VLTRGFIQDRKLADVLPSAGTLIDNVRAGLPETEVFKMLGLELLAVSIAAIKPTPEMAKALQASAREALLREADEAVSARRNAAVEMERETKENELRTEIAVAAKRREIRETEMAGDIAVEEQRAQLVSQQADNARLEAEARGAALAAVLAPLKDIDWRTLMAASGDGLDSRKLMSMAFRDMADNAEKIGNLNISPDLLSTLLDDERD